MNCIIVDDEPLARAELAHLIHEVSNLNIAGMFSSVKLAQDYLALHTVDIIFLDIHMPGMSGLEFAATINKTTKIIFTTAYSQYALKSYEVEAIDYLLKPIEGKRLVKAIDKASRFQEVEPKTIAADNVLPVEDFIIIRSERMHHKVYFQDILFIEGMKDYSIIYGLDEKWITAMNLKTTHLLLPADRFIRVSKSYIVAIAKVERCDNKTLMIKDKEVPLGDRYRDQFLTLWKKTHNR
ncbi:LytR/AlgR family response regulator transcription factor [Sphingobacterium sp. HJSM2_6]|uniref:LytR/AlgR family response regulator transcription factor n=1 Tax=Sphingobacterium sp. HJSM2_6 TaxID=3366264 RepID=UPI003BEB338A